METNWEVTVIDRDFEVIYSVTADSADRAKRAARAFFGIDAKIVRAVKVPRQHFDRIRAARS